MYLGMNRAIVKHCGSVGGVWMKLGELRTQSPIAKTWRNGCAAPSIYYNLGYLCGKEGHIGKARFYYEKQMRLGPRIGRQLRI